MIELEDILKLISDYGIPLLGVLGLLLALLLVGLVRRRREETALKRCMRSVAVDMLSDVVIPDGAEGEIHLDHVLLTAKGLVVVDVKEVRGTVFGSDRMDDWTVMTDERRFTFPNPQHALYDRVAAIRSLMADVPIKGHVLFDARADFSKGRPKHVIQPTEFAQKYRKPSRGELRHIMDAFRPFWERLKEETVATRVARFGET